MSVASVAVNAACLLAGGAGGFLAGRYIPSERKVAKKYFDKFASMAVVLLSIASLVTVAWYAKCQSDYNAAFADGLTQRSAAATKERDAQRRLTTAQQVLLSAKPATPAEGAAVLMAYQDAQAAYQRSLDEADADRSAAPVPARPSCS